MTDQTRVTELIERYLDGIATPEEVRELDHRISTDPNVARAFAERARFDGQMSDLYSQLNAESLFETDQEIEQEPMQPRRKIRWFQGERFWVPTAAIAYALVLIVCLRYLVIRPDPIPTGVEVELAQDKSIDLDQFEEELDSLEALYAMASRTTDPEATIEFHRADDLRARALEVPSTSAPEDLPILFAGPDEAGIVVVSGRAKHLSPQAAEAVSGSLEWLAQHQQPDGSWNGPPQNDQEANDTATTSLALMAFLASGETSASAQYGHTIRNALRFLLEQQEQNSAYPGAYCDLGDKGIVAHSLVSLAMGQAHRTMRIPTLWRSVEFAAACTGSDLDALRTAARRTDVMASPIPEGVQNSGAYVLSAPDLDPALREQCMDLVESGFAESMSREDYMEGVFHLSQALFGHGGPIWTRWNKKFTLQYIRNQNPDGSWSSPYPGSTGPASHEENYGQSLSTALGALLLQEYEGLE